MSDRDGLRVSQHSGRSGSAKHNDRAFLEGRSDEWRQEHAPHIDPARTGENVVWTWDGQTSVEASERAWYSEAYAQAQEQTNERYRHEGHADRCKTTDDLYTGRLTRPEEMILQVGDRHTDIDLGRLGQALDAYLGRLDAWNEAHGGHMHILSMALHLDETSPHVHIRRVWDYTDRDGLTRLGQARALEAAGIQLPDPGKPTGRYNNRKITFDGMARGWWQECCREQGWDIVTEPRPDMRHKSKQDYIRDQMAAEIDGLTATIDKNRQDAAAADMARQDAQQRAQEAAREAQETERRLFDARTELDAIEARTRALTAAEVERMRGQHRGLFGLRLVRSDDWGRVMDTARQAEESAAIAAEATARADAIEQERDTILRQAQEQADALMRQAQQRSDELTRGLRERQQELDIALQQAREQADAIIQQAENDRARIIDDCDTWLGMARGDVDYLDTNGVRQNAARDRLATKLLGIMEYRQDSIQNGCPEGYILQQTDQALDHIIDQLPTVPPAVQELMRMQEQIEQDEQMVAETRKRTHDRGRGR